MVVRWLHDGSNTLQDSYKQAHWPKGAAYRRHTRANEDGVPWRAIHVTLSMPKLAKNPRTGGRCNTDNCQRSRNPALFVPALVLSSANYHEGPSGCMKHISTQ